MALATSDHHGLSAHRVWSQEDVWQCAVWNSESEESSWWLRSRRDIGTARRRCSRERSSLKSRSALAHSHLQHLPGRSEDREVFEPAWLECFSAFCEHSHRCDSERLSCAVDHDCSTASVMHSRLDWLASAAAADWSAMREVDLTTAPRQHQPDARDSTAPQGRHKSEEAATVSQSAEEPSRGRWSLPARESSSEWSAPRSEIILRFKAVQHAEEKIHSNIQGLIRYSRL